MSKTTEITDASELLGLAAVESKAAVAPRSNQRIDEHVPHLRDQDYETGERRLEPEVVRQVIDEYQAGKGREPSGSERPDRVGGDG